LLVAQDPAVLRDEQEAGQSLACVPQVRCELDTQIGVPSWGNVQ
jgi:hypothetical protein